MKAMNVYENFIRKKNSESIDPAHRVSRNSNGGFYLKIPFEIHTFRSLQLFEIK